MTLPFDHFVVLDFEATCKPGEPPVPQEVIELPSVLVSLRDRAVLDSFSSFVRPVHHPVLDPFCTELTSIEQHDVDGALPFLDVYAAHRAWLAEHGLLAPRADGSPPFVFVTCGDWDLTSMLPVQCAASSLAVTDLPLAYRRWCNIKKVFGEVFGRKKGFGMPTMLETLGLELEGRHHRGIDDCHNIARIALALVDRGGVIDVTGKLSASRYPSLRLTLRYGDETREVVLERRAVPTLLGLASGAFRTRMVEAHAADGALLTDDTLFELAQGSVVTVGGHVDPGA